VKGFDNKVIRFANPKEPKTYIKHTRDTLTKQPALQDEA